MPDRPPKTPAFFTIPEAAERAGINRARLSALRKAGRGPKETHVGHRVLFRRSDLDRWILQRQRAKAVHDHRQWRALEKRRSEFEAVIAQEAEAAPSSEKEDA